MSAVRVPRPGRWWIAPVAMLIGGGLAACSLRGGDDGAATLVIDDAGVVAYVDEAGCIVRVGVSDPERPSEPYCPPTRTGVSAITWVGSQTLLYVTPETAKQGWRRVDFASGKDDEVPVDEAPRILQTTGAAQAYSINGERIEVDASGTVFRLDNDGTRTLILRRDEAKGGATAPRLATWSPDGEWVLLERSADNALWAVRRDGTEAHEVASSSRSGLFSWYMPRAGVMPHADLTCSLPTAETWACVVSLRLASAPDPGTETTLTWSTCPGATGYEVAVFAAGAEEGASSAIVAGTSYRLAAETLRPAPAEGWRWRVRPLIGTKPGVWSATGVLASGAD